MAIFERLIMRNYFIALLVGVLNFTAGAQFVIATDNVTGLPMTAKVFDKSKSNPYLYSETFNGKVVLADGKDMGNLNLLYDLELDIPLFIDAKGNFLKLNKTPLAFEFTTPENGLQVYKRGYPAMDKYTNDTFYQVLAEGKMQLVKKPKKSFTESTPYGTVGVVKQAIVTDTYYLSDGQQLKKIGKDPKALINALKDKKAVLTDSLATLKSKNLRNEEMMVLLLRIYNASN